MARRHAGTAIARQSRVSSKMHARSKVKRNDLQWLRAAAAIEVIISHSDLVTKHFSTTLINSSSYKSFSGIGVELFFILSGYLICQQAPTYKSGRDFMVSRFLRLAPMYWIGTTLVVIAFSLNHNWKLGGGLAESPLTYALMSYLFLPQSAYPILSVGWTLELEMAFYAIVALAMIVLPSVRGVEGRAVALTLALLGCIGFAFGTGPIGGAWDYSFLSPYMLAFGAGWLLRLLDESGGARQNLTAVSAFLLIAVLGPLTNSVDAALLYRIAVAAAIFIAVCHFGFYFEINNRLNRAMGRIGDASYSLYLFHWFVLSIVGKMAGVLNLPTSFDIPVRVLTILLCIGISCLIFTLVENPVDRYLRGSTRQKKTLSKHMTPAAVLNQAGR
jgi:exopolysaccharide production protein ExoZ